MGGSKPSSYRLILEKIKEEEERGGACLNVGLWFSCQAFEEKRKKITKQAEESFLKSLILMACIEQTGHRALHMKQWNQSTMSPHTVYLELICLEEAA